MPRHTDNTWLERISGYLKSLAGVVSGSADGNAPTQKVGGEYNSSTNTYVNGARVALQLDVNGNLKVISTPTTVSQGRKTVASAGTAEALAASTVIKSVTITAETDNTGVVTIGGAGVIAALSTRTGTPLNAGESFSLDIANLASVYADVTVSGDGVTYTAVA